MANPAPAKFDHVARRRTLLALAFWTAPLGVLFALCAGYALAVHGQRLAGAALLLLTAAVSALAGLWLVWRARDPGHAAARDLLCHGGGALALYCLSLLAGFGLVLGLLVGHG